ncbi:unnamed protein product, partial [Pylaiella littoralis]
GEVAGSGCDCSTPGPTAVTSQAPSPTQIGTTDKLRAETRTIFVKNACSFDLDLGFTGGFAGSAPCSLNQMEDGTSGRCFWDLDIPTYSTAGEESVLTIHQSTDQENEVVVSGQIYALRSPYMNDVCPDGCNASQGPSGTVTLFEFTVLLSNLSYYDISNVHGANLPATFGPPDSETVPEDPYRNGVAGKHDSSWHFEPPEQYKKYLIEVINAHGSCSIDTDCDQHETCGASFSQEEPLHGTCGDLTGYLNAHTNGIAGSTGYPFYCDTYHDLYACAEKYQESGYSNSVTNNLARRGVQMDRVHKTRVSELLQLCVRRQHVHIYLRFSNVRTCFLPTRQRARVVQPLSL